MFRIFNPLKDLREGVEDLKRRVRELERELEVVKANNRILIGELRFVLWHDRSEYRTPAEVLQVLLEYLNVELKSTPTQAAKLTIKVKE